VDRSVADVGHKLVFAADDGVHGIALWTSDGTECGTRLIRQLWRQADRGLPIGDARGRCHPYGIHLPLYRAATTTRTYRSGRRS
jgi:ELWxxDGT repeat protein